ncbi:MAG: sugar transferase [Chloroflexi bacterium]|nr:sugar transferase [Chloroflexota bacterium]
MYQRYGKRTLDVMLTLLALFLLSPILMVIAFVVRAKLGVPILFRQQRPGLRGTPFMVYKFRTMTDARDAQGNLRSDNERLTELGRFLRATSLDELPELFNVLKGEMSLVGPRPLLMRYNPYFTDEELPRFTVRPGITGLAQVSGRNDLSWDERIASDVRYVREISLGLDLKIIMQTVGSVLTRQGLQVDPGSTMRDLDEERRERANLSSEV